MQSIYKFTISMMLSLVVYSAQAQDKNRDSIQAKTNWLNGITLQADLASLVSSAIDNGESYSLEGGALINIKNKYYPIVEIGFAGADKTTAENINFKTNGLFGRMGVDFSLKKSKPNAKVSNNLVSAGVRLGMSNFAYNINNIVITDDYWKNSESKDFNNMTSTNLWYELVFGVRVEVIKNIYMGWSIRNKHLITKNAAGEVFPWYIPGYGKNATSNWGINYSLGYKF